MRRSARLSLDTFGKLALPSAAVIAALVFALLTIVPRGASAHHPQYEAEVDCFENWSAVAEYIGGGGRRLVLISEGCRKRRTVRSFLVERQR